jgi:hypothetical protein
MEEVRKEKPHSVQMCLILDHRIENGTQSVILFLRGEGRRFSARSADSRRPQKSKRKEFLISGKEISQQNDLIMMERLKIRKKSGRKEQSRVKDIWMGKWRNAQL